MLSLVFVLIAATFAQVEYDTVQYYIDSNCVNNYVALTVVLNTGVGDTCRGTDCTQVGGSQTYQVTNCAVTSIPSNPGNAVVYTHYSASTSCSGAIDTVFAATSGACFSQSDISSGIITCAGALSYDLEDCPANANVTSSEGFEGLGNAGCFVDNDGTTSSSLSCPKCFHKDTQIGYAGQSITLADIKKGHASCAVPHTFHAAGLKITTSCEGSLRVTGEHLVYTQKGLVQAHTIKVGDFLYGDHEEKKTCEVRSVEVEQGEYFGLNCEESIVLADGYKTSTFGLTHDIPAIWMKVASKLFGIETASAWGDALSSIFSGLF